MAGTIRGTPDFMSPEQTNGHTCDHLTDIFAIGLIMYGMLVRESPYDKFDGNVRHFDLFMRARNTPLERPSVRFGINLPPGVEDMLMKCLEVDKTKRFQSTIELKEAISALDFSPLPAIPPPPPSIAVLSPNRHLPFIVGAAAAAAIAVGGIGAYFAGVFNSHAPVTATSTQKLRTNTVKVKLFLPKTVSTVVPAVRPKSAEVAEGGNGKIFSFEFTGTPKRMKFTLRSKGYKPLVQEIELGGTDSEFHSPNPAFARQSPPSKTKKLAKSSATPAKSAPPQNEEAPVDPLEIDSE